MISPRPAREGAARYRLLALDLDGTVLSLDLRLDPRDVAALRRAEDAGITVIACTGRPFPGAMPWIRALGLDQPFVCYQGAQVRTPAGEVLLDDGIDHHLAMEVVRYCRERDLHVQAYRDDRLLVEVDRPEAHEYANHAQMQIHVVGDFEQAMGPTTPKLVIVAARAVVEGLLPDVRERWRDRLYAATSMPTYLELTSARADKRRALEFICRRLGIPSDEIVAVGDGRNDQPMIEWAGLGYAVEGAPEEVVAAAGGRVIGAPGSAGIAGLVELLLNS